MCVLGSGQTQCSLQGDLARSAAQKVGTAYDVRDVLGSIVDDDRQLICKQTVAPTDHEVTRIAGKVRGLHSLQPVREFDRAGRYAKADGEGPVGGPYTVATPTGVVELVGSLTVRRLHGLQLCPAARARESETCGEEFVERRSIRSCALTLFRDRPVPFEAESSERCDDVVGAAGHFTRRIEIFDSQQPLAAGAASIEITGSRCD